MPTKIKYPYPFIWRITVAPANFDLYLCLVILIILLDLFKCQYTYIHLIKETQDFKFEVDLLIGEGFIDEAHRLAQEHHIDHWYWWDRIKENKSENAENKSSNNTDDNGDPDKNNSPSSKDSKGEESRGSQGEMR